MATFFGSAVGTVLGKVKAATEAAALRRREKMVGREGIEPPTPGFSVLCSTN
jgi:hypothetical protein